MKISIGLEQAARLEKRYISKDLTARMYGIGLAMLAHQETGVQR